MKIPSRVDSSVCGAVLSKRPSATTLSRKSPAVAATTASSSGSRRCATLPKQHGKLDRGFFCPRTSNWLLSTFVSDAPSSIRHASQARQARASSYSTAAAAAAAQDHDVHRTRVVHSPEDKRELMSYVQGDEEGTAEEHFDYYRDPYRRGYAPAYGPKLEVSERPVDYQYPSKDDAFHLKDHAHDITVKLLMAISQRIRHPSRISLDRIYKLYCQLPEPKMLYLSWQWRDRLLKVMGTPRKRDSEAMLRYFALVADVKNAGLALRRTQWNFALTFAAKYVSRPGSQEVESALRLWREMEREAGIKGNDVTFNILFDVAAKAGNYALAEMIYKEMELRGLRFNRFHHVSLIHYFGLRLDSGGIRAAYKELVESGEMVDTTVLNCVIAGLLRCGEETAAEDTYERMKQGQVPQVDGPSRDYMTNKVITRVLMMFSKVGKQHPQLQSSLQTGILLAPDLRTFRLLVEHHGLKSGDLAKVAQYLDEMKQLNIPVHPTIFLDLFKGFHSHGGFEGSDWSQQRLESVLAALYEAYDGKARGFRIDRWLVIWALRAVKTCSGNEAAMSAFEALSQRWDIPPDRVSFMHEFLENLIGERDLKAHWRGQGIGQRHRDWQRK